MSLFQLTGTRIDAVPAAGERGLLTINLPASANGRLSYEVLGFDGGIIPSVAFDLSGGGSIAINGVFIDSPVQNIDAYLGYINWGSGKRTEILTVEFGGQDEQYIFELGGDALPEVNNRAQVLAFSEQVTGGGIITSGPFRPDTPIDIISAASAQEASGFTVTGSTGDEVVDGSTGDDVLSGLGGEDTLNGGTGDDVIRGGREDDVLRGGGGNDRMYGQADDDLLNGGGGNDLLNGGGGSDRVNGGKGNDFVKSGGGDDVSKGGAGNDKVFGNAGADRLDGGAGQDLVNGGGDDDVLIGGRGNDVLKGGGGADVFVFANGHGRDVVRDFDASSDAEVIDLSGLSSISSIGALNGAATQQGSGVMIDTGNGNSIFLQNVSLSDLGADDFLF
ncbi:MAG: calcium-binding protein [Sulfitobacter sp.]